MRILIIRSKQIWFGAVIAIGLVGGSISFSCCQPKPESTTHQVMDIGDVSESYGGECIQGDTDGCFGAELEPGPGDIYHCAQGEVRPMGVLSRHVDWAGIEAYVAAGKHRPKLIMHYITLDPLGFRLLKNTLVNIAQQPFDYVPQIGLDFYSYLPWMDVLSPRDITQKIAEGAYDERIRELANIFKNMGRPAFLRPGYEFGGNGQGRHANKRYWVDAWNRIYNIFQTEGVHGTAFVWHTLNANDFMDYYPGDDYVDWWGVSVFVNNADQDPFLNRFIRAAALHRKPVMIAEATPKYVGSVGRDESWKQWYQPIFNLLFTYPHVKAFCYINASWGNYPDKTFLYDARIQSNGFITEQFREMLSSPRFVHSHKRVEQK